MGAAAKAIAKKTKAAQSNSEVRPPEQFVPKVKPGPPEGLYPDDAELYSYTPRSTGETIWFPMKFEQPKAVQVWELYDKPLHVQSWSWMKWANIPRIMQRKAVELLDSSPDEYLELFDGWFAAVGGVKPGE
jgi:hypothetical protein